MRHGKRSRKALLARRLAILEEMRSEHRGEDGTIPPHLDALLVEQAAARSVAERAVTYSESNANSLAGQRQQKTLKVLFDAQDRIARLAIAIGEFTAGSSRPGQPTRVLFGGRYRPGGELQPEKLEIELTDASGPLDLSQLSPEERASFEQLYAKAKNLRPFMENRITGETTYVRLSDPRPGFVIEELTAEEIEATKRRLRGDWDDEYEYQADAELPAVGASATPAPQTAVEAAPIVEAEALPMPATAESKPEPVSMERTRVLRMSSRWS
jgi:hypothetical protein